MSDGGMCISRLQNTWVLSAKKNKSFEKNAFKVFGSLNTLYYSGTMHDWSTFLYVLLCILLVMEPQGHAIILRSVSQQVAMRSQRCGARCFVSVSSLKLQ